MAAPRGPSTVGSLRSILHRAVPALVGFAVIVALGVVAWRVGESNLRDAESDRLGARVHAVTAIARNVRDNLSPDPLHASVARNPFAPGADSLDALLLGQFQTSDAPEAVVGLVGVDGRTLAAVPAHEVIDVTALGSAWTEAVAGRPALTDVFRRRGGVVNATLAPVGSPTPWAVVVVVEAARVSAGQAFHEQIGSLNGEPGGLVLVDRGGVAVNSWSLDELGRPVVTAADVAGLERDEARVWTVERDGAEVTLVATSTGQGYGLLFEQETTKLYGDLVAAQHQRNLVVSAVLAVALVALVAFQLSREVGARRAEAKLQALLKNSQDLLLVVDGTTRMRFVSAALEPLLGQPVQAWVGSPLVERCHPEDVPGLTYLVEHPESGPLLNVRLPGEDGEYRWFDVDASDLRDHAEVGGVLLTCHEIGRRKALQDELSHQATHDRLTGLPNRAQFSERLERMLRGVHPARPFALLYLDLDYFKPINDTLGHDAGDEVLVVIAQRLQAAASPGGFVSRLGGDEFAVLLDGADRGRAVTVAEALLAAARAPVAIGPRLAYLDASIGIALTDPASEIHNPEQLVRAADEAMYHAKQAGRGRFAFAQVPASPAPSVAEVVTPVRPGARGGDDPVATAAPASPSVGPDAAARPSRRRAAAVVPAVIATVLVLAVAGLGYQQGVEQQRRAEADHLSEQRAYAVRAADFYSKLSDPRPLVAAASAAPWTLTGSAVDQAVIRTFAEAPSAGRDAVAFLATPEGRVLASSRPDATLLVPPSSPVWRAALRGEGNQLSQVADPDQPRSYFVLPVLREGRTVAVVALGLSLRHGPAQVALEQGGSAGYRTGGWSLVNSEGIIYVSWNQALIGTRVVDPTRLAGLEPGTGRDLSDHTDVLVVSPMTSTYDPTYLVFAMPAADFLRDLRLGQLPRLATLLAVVAAAVAGLVFVNHRREQAMRRDEARLDALLHQAHDVILVVDEAGRASFVSSAVHYLLAYPRGAWIGQVVLDVVHPEDRSRFTTLLADTQARGAASATDVRIRHADGEYRWFDIDAVDLRHHRQVHGVLLTGHEVTERRELQQQLEHRARHDPLTGLPNRATLAERLNQLARSDVGPFAVLFVDLDHFKVVNDTLGHDAGDTVLRITADRFRAGVRMDAGDGSGDIVCRLGGDEFAVILRNATAAIARATADRLIEAAQEPITVDGHQIRIGATIGISLSEASAEDPDSALRRADQAMYQAKGSGRGTYAVSPTLD